MKKSVLSVGVRLHQVEGRLEIEGVAVLFGMPKSGKTWVLKAIYGALYVSQYGVPPKEFVVMTRRGGFEVSLSLGIKTLHVACREDEDFRCERRGRLYLTPLYVPPFAEAIIKYRPAP